MDIVFHYSKVEVHLVVANKLIIVVATPTAGLFRTHFLLVSLAPAINRIEVYFSAGEAALAR